MRAVQRHGPFSKGIRTRRSFVMRFFEFRTFSAFHIRPEFQSGWACDKLGET